MNKPEVPTLEDVASAAKVSTATVSRALNSPERVSEKTRAKVLKVVDRLGYSPNFGARALAAKRTNTFGAVVPTMNNAIFATGLQAFQEELGKHGATLLLASSSYDPEVEESQIRALVAKGADGLLLIGTNRSDEIYNFLDDRQIPYVLTWSVSDDKDKSSVGFDNFQATYDLAKKAIELGHKKFAVISAHTTTNDRARQRVAGIKAALTDHQVDTGKVPVIEVPYSIDSGSEGMKIALQSERAPTIVMCGNDVLAAGAMKMARSMGLQVPTDISITGFDDIELAKAIEPPLTTVHVPHQEMGTLAAQTLIKKIGDREYQENVRLETYIVDGMTLAPPLF